MKPSEVLTGARSLILEKGLWKASNPRLNPDGNCPITAMSVVSGEYGEAFLDATHAFRVILTRRSWVGILEFADDDSTTEANVLLVFDKAILLAKETES